MEQERYVIFITNTLLSEFRNLESLTDLGIGAIPRRTPPARISDFSLLSKQIHPKYTQELPLPILGVHRTGNCSNSLAPSVGTIQ
jgi:hypothetical protein